MEDRFLIFIVAIMSAVIIMMMWVYNIRHEKICQRLDALESQVVVQDEIQTNNPEHIIIDPARNELTGVGYNTEADYPPIQSVLERYEKERGL